MNESTTHGGKTRARIIDAGLELWRADSALVTARRVGAALQMTHSAVLYHFGTTGGLKAALAVEAINRGDSVIVPQLIATRHPAAAGLTPEERQRFLAGCCRIRLNARDATDSGTLPT